MSFDPTPKGWFPKPRSPAEQVHNVVDHRDKRGQLNVSSAIGVGVGGRNVGAVQ